MRSFLKSFAQKKRGPEPKKFEGSGYTLFFFAGPKRDKRPEPSNFLGSGSGCTPAFLKSYLRVFREFDKKRENLFFLQNMGEKLKPSEKAFFCVQSEFFEKLQDCNLFSKKSLWM